MATRIEASKPGRSCESRVTRSWSCTKLEKSVCMHSWVITDFSLRQEQTGSYIESPPFCAAGANAPKWCLRLFPNGNTVKNKEYVSLFLTPWRDTEVTAKFELWIVNANGVRAEEKVVSAHKFLRCEDWGYSSFVARKKLFDRNSVLLSDDALTLCCEVITIGDTTVNTFALTDVVPEFRLHNDLGDLYAKGTLSDVTITADGECFHAHKAILAARSPVLAAMLKHDMQETQQNRIVIEDLSGEVVGEMLLFIYTGSAPRLESMASDLLVAADKYNIDRLKIMCGEHLFSKLTSDTAVDLLILADRHSLGGLKNRVLEYINARAMEVIATISWKRMVKEEPHILSDIITAQVAQKNNAPKRGGRGKK